MAIDYYEHDSHSDSKLKLEAIPDDPRCPYCGGLLVQQERTFLDKTTIEEGLFALADTLERYGVYAVGALLLRCRYPRESGAKLSRRLGITRVEFFRLYSRVCREAPAVAKIIRGYEKTRGRAGGRKSRGAK